MLEYVSNLNSVKKQVLAFDNGDVNSVMHLQIAQLSQLGFKINYRQAHFLRLKIIFISVYFVIESLTGIIEGRLSF